MRLGHRVRTEVCGSPRRAEASASPDMSVDLGAAAVALVYPLGKVNEPSGAAYSKRTYWKLSNAPPNLSAWRPTCRARISQTWQVLSAASAIPAGPVALDGPRPPKLYWLSVKMGS